MQRRDFLKYSILLSVILSTEGFARGVNFKIPKKRKDLFFKLREEILFRPYNVELINGLLDFNKKIGDSAYKDKEMKSLLMFLYSNSRNVEAMKNLKEAIWNPIIQSDEEIAKIKENKAKGKSLGNMRLLDKEKELKKYRKNNFRASFETLLFFRLSGMTEEEKTMRDEVENNNRIFNPSKEKEIYYKILYYISVGDSEEANYTFDEVKKKLKEVIAVNEKKRIFAKKRRKRMHTRAKSKEKKEIIMKDIFLAYTAGLGAFLNRYDEDTMKKYSNMTKDLAYPHSRNFYFYQMYSNYLIYEDYDKAIEYLGYIKENDPYKGINEEMFAVLVNSSIKNSKEKKWKNAWISSKEAIILGMNLDYKKYYKTVIEMKRIFRTTGLKYIKELLRTKDRDLAKEVYDETNRILKLTRSKL